MVVKVVCGGEGSLINGGNVVWYSNVGVVKVH